MSDNLPVGPDDSAAEVTMPVAPYGAMPGPDMGTSNEPEHSAQERDPWKRYIAAVIRYKWLVMIVAALGILGGLGASRFIKPKYAVQATIWIDIPSPTQRREAANTRPSQLLESTAWLDLLKSYVVFDHVVREMQMYLGLSRPDDYSAFASLQLADVFQPGGYVLAVDEAGREFTLSTRTGTILQRGSVGDSVGQVVGLLWVPPAEELSAGRTLQFSVASPRDVSDGQASKLKARVDRQHGNFLRLSIEGTDSKRTADFLNAISERFVYIAGEFKRQKLEELTKTLEDQFEQAERDLRRAEAALEAFRVQTIVLPSTTEAEAPASPGLDVTEDPVYSSFFELKNQRDELRRDREAIERVLAVAPDSGLAADALEMVPAVEEAEELTAALEERRERRTELRAMRFSYTDEHPPVQRLIKEIAFLEEQTIVELASGLAADLAARQARVEERIRAVSIELQQIPPRAIEEGRLERNVETAETLTQTVQKQLEEARLAAASILPDVRVLDYAVAPQHPTNGGRKPLVILMASMMGLGIALLGAVLLDRFDPRLRYPEQVSDDLGLTILGTLPHIKGRNGRLTHETSSQIIESLRNIRLTLSHVYGPARPVMITITSAGSEEGKSFITSNLALSFAELNLRTLVIDGDLRRGNLHRLLDGERKPGLSDFLAGRATRKKILQKTDDGSLSLIGCGTRLRAGPELLQSNAMPELLAELKSDFDVILVDSPPLAGGVDPLVLGTLTGNLLMVLRTGATNRGLAGAKLELVDRLPIRILGAVLNDVPESRIYGYTGYLPGYATADEEYDELEKGREVKVLRG